MKRIFDLRKAIASGIIIGLCCRVYQQCPNKIVGAVLFGLGLVTICMCDLQLFTGRVGSHNNILDLYLMFVFNLIGILFVRVLFAVECIGFTEFACGFGCGALMQIGVVGYKKNKSYITVMCIAAFLLGGFMHCIAQVYFMELSALTLIKYAVVVLGNIVGARFLRFLGVHQEAQNG